MNGFQFHRPSRLKISWMEAKTQWDEGALHGFPRCCRARFIVDQFRPKLMELTLPQGVSERVRRLTHPRLAISDGMVPCEAHLLAYLVNGDKTNWRKPLAPGMCCQLRSDLVSGGHIKLYREIVDAESLEGAVVSDSKMVIWLFGVNHDDCIGINNCPYCGSDLENVK